MTDDGQYDGYHTVAFTQTRFLDRVRNFLPFLPKEIPLFAAVVISFWGIAQVLSELAGESLELRNLAGPALITALVVTAYKATQGYNAFVPDVLTLESKVTRSIFRKGRCGWQFALARQMLKERTDGLDRALGRMESGAHFVYPRQLDTPEYLVWLRGRPEVLSRLLRAVAVQCVSEIPAILARTRNEMSLDELCDSVEQLSSLYKETVEFERQSRGTDPPPELSEVHEMIYGWSDPIRFGIQQFLDVLKSISEVSAVDLKRGTAVAPSFEIKFSPPANIDEFIRRLRAASL